MGVQYRIEVIALSNSWEANVYDLPAYGRSDEMEVQPPISRENGLDNVIGPIDFGSEAGLNLANQTQNGTGTNTTERAQRGRRTRFSLQPSEEDESPPAEISYALSIYDNDGAFIDTPIYRGNSRTQQSLIGSTEESQTEPVVLPTANVGFIQVSSTIFWSLSVEDRELSEINTS